MGESSVPKREPSKASKEHSFQSTARGSPLNKFGTVVRALWPDKPALNLAQRAGLSERGAQFIIDGKRKPNAKAALAVYAEIIG